MSIYVELPIHASMERLWELTQRPELHTRWDLRFTSISYLPRAKEDAPQCFRYETRLGFGMRIAGEGESVGAKEGSGGVRTSALRFWSDDPWSLIRTGSGYWQYIPAGAADGAVVFLTRYDYETRYGLPGRLFDRMVFRPLIGWATAWSFDRLRLWAESGIDPAVSLQRSIVNAITRGGLAATWLYQGIVPKLLVPDSGEVAIMQGAGFDAPAATTLVRLTGVAEVAFAAALLIRWRGRGMLVANVVILVILAVGAAVSAPAIFVAPFNPVALTLAMVALSCVGLAVGGEPLPSAGRCRRRPARGQAEAA